MYNNNVSIRKNPDKTETKLDTVIEVKNLNFYYGDHQALSNINMEIYRNKITALIGPSGCGKSTFIRCLNRMNDLIENTSVDGEVLYNGQNIYQKDVDPVRLRRKIGMVFQAPNPLPKSIFDNIAYGPRMYGIRNKQKLRDITIESLKKSALYEEVKSRLDVNALSLSGGQQQRLCIARTIAVEPDIILMDEPASALDPIATMKIEDLMMELTKNFTIIIVTHNMQQASRVSDYTAFFMVDDKRSGYLVEYGKTQDLFLEPQKKETEDYISGRFG
jgi:phosphate transport system ATP-binding protein